MLKTITAIVAASIATAALVTPKPAEASCLGCRIGGGVGGAFASPFASPFAPAAYGFGYPGYGYRAYGYAPYAYAPAYYRYAPRPGYVRHYERQYVRRYH
jgi:hypothetical protein